MFGTYYINYEGSDAYFGRRLAYVNDSTLNISNPGGMYTWSSGWGGMNIPSHIYGIIGTIQNL
jgi:hypothetical protein